MLVLTGSRDIVTLPAASQTITSAVQQGRLVEIEGCGHMGFMERADVYNTAIADFAAARFADPVRPSPEPIAA